MATTGSVDVNLTSISNTINNGTALGHYVLAGIAAQGSLIGTAIGITLAVGLLFGIVFLVVGVIPKLIAKVKGLRGGG